MTHNKLEAQNRYIREYVKNKADKRKTPTADQIKAYKSEAEKMGFSLHQYINYLLLQEEQ